MDTHQKQGNGTSGQGFEGDRFNSFDGSSHHAGPKPGRVAPDHHPQKNLHYDLNQIISPAQRALIKSSGIMAFHCIGDTGNDHAHNHNGGPDKRQDVADMMVAELKAGAGKADSPCFCYHVGDVIYPGSEEAKYEEEFYQPYRNYANAIVAIPGNHDSYGPDGLEAYAENFMQPHLSITPGTRPAMNLPWYHWVMDTPVATIIGISSISNYISSHQQSWFQNEMNTADPNKALIVATHYPPYCFDGSNNSAIRNCIDSGIASSGRTPDLVLCGHSHNYQRIQVPANANRPCYTVIVNGAGGVSTGGVKPWTNGNGGKLQAHNDTDFGALTLVIDSNKSEIRCEYHTAVSKAGKVATHLFDQFTIGTNPRKCPS